MRVTELGRRRGSGKEVTARMKINVWKNGNKIRDTCALDV